MTFSTVVIIGNQPDFRVGCGKLGDDGRVITSYSIHYTKLYDEVVGMEGDVITLQDIFVYEKRGIDKNGKVLGRFRATGIRPKFSERLELAGIEVPEDLFSTNKYYE